jgi:hypothetical protein
MSLPDEIRELADRILGRLDEARDFYLHTRQAWRVVQQIAHEGRSVGIVDTATGQEVSAPDLEPKAQRYVTVLLAESTFKGLSGVIEDWVVGLASLWLTAYPVQLDTAYNEAADRSRSQRRDEIQVTLSEILAAPDRAAILAGVVERVVRELALPPPCGMVSLPGQPGQPRVSGRNPAWGSLRTQGGPRHSGAQRRPGRSRLHQKGGQFRAQRRRRKGRD